MSSAIKELHADFLEELEIGQGRSQKTVENYDRYLKKYYKKEQISEVKDITADSVRSFRRWLNEATPRGGDKTTLGVSLATQNYHLIALRQFLKYLAKRDVKALSAEKIGLAKLGERDIDVLYPEEADSLMGAPSLVETDNQMSKLSVLRDKALLEVLYSTGMRVAEVVALDRDDVPGRALMGSSSDEAVELPIKGKGNKVRVVFLSGSAQKALAAYAAEREDMDPAMFVRHSPNIKEGSNLRLTTRSVQRMIKKYAQLAGLTKKITPHTLRHSFATDLLANGADVRQVQQLLGHASITTTQVYTHLTDVHLRDVHEKFHRKKGD